MRAGAGTTAASGGSARGPQPGGHSSAEEKSYRDNGDIMQRGLLGQGNRPAAWSLGVGDTVRRGSHRGKDIQCAPLLAPLHVLGLTWKRPRGKYRRHELTSAKVRQQVR